MTATPDRSWWDEGGGAFPCGEEFGMTLRDWFATFAPEPSDAYIDSEKAFDAGNNRYNELGKPPLRGSRQIRAEARFEWADAMLAARAK